MPLIGLTLVDFSPDENGDAWGLVVFALAVVALPIVVGLVWRYADRRRERP